MMSYVFRYVFGLDLCASATLCNGGNPMPYQNPSLPVEARIHDLLQRMTLEEKCAQLSTATSYR